MKRIRWMLVWAALGAGCAPVRPAAVTPTPVVAADSTQHAPGYWIVAVGLGIAAFIIGRHI